MKYHYFRLLLRLFRYAGLIIEQGSPSGGLTCAENTSQVGSLAGAAHLLNDNTGVLR